MSTMALKTLLKRLTTTNGGTFDNKELKKLYAYKAPHSLVIKQNEFVEEFVDATTKAYDLSEDDQDEITGIVLEQWPGIVTSFRTQLKDDKNLEILEISDAKIVLLFFNKQNYGRIDDAFFKNDARYTHFFKPLFTAVNEYLKGIGKKVFISKGKLGTRFKRIEETGISDYFNQGHYDGSSVHYTIASRFLPIKGEKNVPDDPTNYLENPDILKVIKSSSIGNSSFNSEVNMLVEAASKLTGGAKPANNDFTKTITVKIESKTKNQLTGSTVEATIRDTFVTHIENVLKGRTPIDWANQESSDSALAIIEKILINTAIKSGAKGKKTTINAQAGKANETSSFKIKGSSSRLGVKNTKNAPKRKTPVATQSYLSLITLINERLPPKVRANMGSPRLNNVTGRLSESARVTNITSTPQGFPSIEYTYLRSPYDVFDKTLGKKPWNTGERDPSTLIGKSVRELAQQMGMNKFYVRRAR